MFKKKIYMEIQEPLSETPLPDCASYQNALATLQNSADLTITRGALQLD